MSAVHAIQTAIITPSTGPAIGHQGATSPPAGVASRGRLPAFPSSLDAQHPSLSQTAGHSPSLPTLPALSPEEDLLFEALARGTTSPAELASALDLPVRHILILLASPAITTHLEALEAATEHLARHTTRLRHNLAFKSLEKALEAAAAKDNPAEIRRIATLLLKPTPPLPDPEAEQAERAERITKHHRAVKDDAKSEQEDAEYAALAAAMVTRSSGSLSRFPGGAGGGRGEGVNTQAAQAPRRVATPAPSSAHPSAPSSTAAPLPPTIPASQSPSHPITGSLSHASPQHHPAQPRAA